MATKRPTKSTAAKPATPTPVVSLVDRGSPSGLLFAVWQSWVYRFMFEDGSTLDVVSDRDDSELRAAVLTHTKQPRIVGVAKIAPDDRRVP